MLRVVVIYQQGRREIPVIETRDGAIAKLVAEAALREYRDGISITRDAVLREVIAGEIEQVLRVLRAAGLEVSDTQEA